MDLGLLKKGILDPRIPTFCMSGPDSNMQTQGVISQKHGTNGDEHLYPKQYITFGPLCHLFPLNKLGKTTQNFVLPHDRRLQIFLLKQIIEYIYIFFVYFVDFVPFYMRKFAQHPVPVQPNQTMCIAGQSLLL